MKSPLFVVEDLPGHPSIVYGLFKMADTFGFPLPDSIIACRKRGWSPGLPAFVCDAIRAGWSADKAIRKVEEALRDLGEQLPDLVRYGLEVAASHADRFSSDTKRKTILEKP